MNDVWVFPSLSKVRIPSSRRRLEIDGPPYLGESAVVPKVALVREAVADEAKLALLDSEQMRIGDAGSLSDETNDSANLWI